MLKNGGNINHLIIPKTFSILQSGIGSCIAQAGLARHPAQGTSPVGFTHLGCALDQGEVRF